MDKHMIVKQKGFTLIEILVVITIIAIAATITLASLGNGRAQRDLETGARELVSIIREAQNDALTGKQLVAGTDPCQYRVSWNGSTYTFTYWYKNASGACSQSSPIMTRSLRPGASFSGSSSVSFFLPHAVTDIPGSTPRSAVATKGGASHVVCVYQNGRIIDQVGAGCP
jgi:prepilin-type N-terminal cleavage/methylation domain-containing protein